MMQYALKNAMDLLHECNGLIPYCRVFGFGVNSLDLNSLMLINFSGIAPQIEPVWIDLVSVKRFMILPSISVIYSL